MIIVDYNVAEITRAIIKQASVRSKVRSVEEIWAESSLLWELFPLFVGYDIF